MYEEDGHTHDTNDPNYDSIEEEVRLGPIFLQAILCSDSIVPDFSELGWQACEENLSYFTTTFKFRCFFLFFQAQFVVSPSSPHMTLEEFEKNTLEIFKEYFEHGDTQEVVDSLEEFNIKNFKPEV